VNAWPLVDGLDDLDGVEITTATPAGVADLLRCGGVDAGLVPSIELLRQEGLEPVGDAGISAYGPVDSVLLLLRRAPREVRTLALDPDSRTSQALARIILQHAFGARFEVVARDPAKAWEERLADAVLVIGDRALEMRAAGAPCLDLAEQWTRWTSLPFVFALWARPRSSRAAAARLEGVLGEARARGLRSIPALARRAAARGPLDAAGFEVYLSRRIRYGLGEWERRGLERFLELAAQSEDPGQPPCST
jgi:chorismate dehydratase